jgi:hypothetical protein
MTTLTLTQPLPAERENVEAEVEIRAAWDAYRKTEKLGLDFGAICYLWQQKFVTKGGVGNKGKGIRLILDKLNIPKSTAYYWMKRYKWDAGLEERPAEPDDLDAPWPTALEEDDEREKLGASRRFKRIIRLWGGQRTSDSIPKSMDEIFSSLENAVREAHISKFIDSERFDEILASRLESLVTEIRKPKSMPRYLEDWVDLIIDRLEEGCIMAYSDEYIDGEQFREVLANRTETLINELRDVKHCPICEIKYQTFSAAEINAYIANPNIYRVCADCIFILTQRRECEMTAAAEDDELTLVEPH